MAKDKREHDELDLRLPSELKYVDFFAEDKKWRGSSGFPTAIPFLISSNNNLESPVESSVETETESDEEDYLAGLTQRMTHSFLYDDEDNGQGDSENKKAFVFATKPANLTVSPQSTLCSYLSDNSNISSPVENSLSVVSSVEEQIGDRDRQTEIKNSNILLTSKNSVGSVNCPASALTNKAKAAQPQPQSAWAGQNKARNNGVGNYRALGVPSSAWPPLQKQKQQTEASNSAANSGTRAAFVNVAGAKKESAGTGVFLPRISGSNTEHRRKTGCSMVLVPARVVQALNLNLDELGATPRFTNDGGYFGYVLNHETLMSRGSSGQSYPKRSDHISSQNATMASNDVHRLPQDWTY